MLYWIMLAAVEAAVILWLVARVMRFQEYGRDWLDGLVFASRARHALHIIASQETPGANATVKRMAKIAREALS